MELHLVNLLLVLLAAWLAGNLAERFRYPSVLGELLAGILLGPPLLGLLHGSEALDILAELGALLMMLYIGMEIDPKELAKASWEGFLAAIGGFITPFVLAYFTVVWFGGSTMAGLFVAIAAAITSLATKSRILVDLQLLDTRVAHVLMAGALISDTLALVVFAGIMGVVEVGELSMARIGMVTLKAGLFFAITTAVGYKVLPWLGRRLTEVGLTGRTFHFTLVLILAISFGELAEVAGLHSILGAFIAGLFIRDNVLGRTLAHDLMTAVREASLGFLAPIFFVTAGFAVSFSVFQGADLALFGAIMGVAIGGKILGTALFYLPTGHGWREGMTIGMGMNGRGAVEIIVAGIALDRGLISEEIFSILVFMAISTTAMVPVMLKWGANWLRERNELVRTRDERHGTVIVGAGPLGRLLAHLLAPSRPVWLVDSNPDRCSLAKDEGLKAFCGNALQEQTLSDAGAAKADSFVALTSNQEVNVLAARNAIEVFEVPEVHVIQVRQEARQRDGALRHLKASSLFGGAVAREEWDQRIAADAYGESEIEITESTTGEAFAADLDGNSGALPVVVRRGDDAMPFHSTSRLQVGDRVVVLLRKVQRGMVPQSFQEAVRQCAILDLSDRLDADELFERAAAALTDNEESKQLLVEALRDREAAGSTVVAPGLAIPHIETPIAGSHPLLIARSSDGIDFPGQAEPVHAVFVLVRRPARERFHLPALAAIATAASRPDFLERWLAADGEDELRDLLL
ncbi:MAG: cation:proton antiporter [Longimicrobiales bacterium]